MWVHAREKLMDYTLVQYMYTQKGCETVFLASIQLSPLLIEVE